MTISIGSDHAGFELKQTIAGYLRDKGYSVLDLGTHSTDSVDYPDYAKAVALAIVEGKTQKGILICGSGIGMSISANRFPEIRAALCTSLYHAEMARMHNDANILVMGARTTQLPDAEGMVDVFLHTEFAGDRHQRRVDKMTNIRDI